MRAQDGTVGLNQSDPKKTTTSSNNGSICSTSCTNKNNLIQILRQRKSELEKLLEEKNQQLQQIQRQESQIIGNEWSSLKSEHFSSTGGSHSNGDPHNSLTLRRKVGSSFKLPRMTKKEHQSDIENLLLEKELQQEICNVSFMLANGLHVTKSERRNLKAKYEAAKQELSAINQNLNVLKKRQLRSYSTSFNEIPLSSNIAAPQSTTSINLKSQHALNSALTTSKAAAAATTTVQVAPLNYHLSQNNECAVLIPPKKNNSTGSYAISSSSSNNNPPRNSKCNKSSYSPSDKRSSVKSAILNLKHDTNPGLMQHFDRTLKNHRSDYDINRIVPQTEKSSNIEGNGVDSRLVGSYPLNFSNNNYCNTFPMQQQHLHQKHHDVIDSNSNHNKQMDGDIKGLIQGNLYNNNDDFDHVTNRYSATSIEKSPNSHERFSLSSSYKRSQSIQQKQHQQHLLDNEEEKIVTLDDNYTPNSSDCLYSRNSTNEFVKPSITWPDPSKRQYYNSYDTVSVYPKSSTSSSILNSSQHQQVGLGGYWRTLPNNERIWHNTDESYSSISQTQGEKTITTMLPTPCKVPPSSYISDEISSTKDEISDKISISSINSETNKKPKEKQWLETSLDAPVIHFKTVYQENAMMLNQRPRLNFRHNNIDYVGFMPPGTVLRDDQYNHDRNPPKTITYRDRSKLSSQSMSFSNKTYRSSVQRLEDQSRLSHSTSVLNKQYMGLKGTGIQHKQPENIPSTEFDSTSFYHNDIEQLQSVPDSHHSHQLFSGHQPLSPLTGKGNSNLTDMTNPELSSLYIYHSPPPPTNNNFYKKNLGSVIMNNMSKAQEIRVESPKNMTVVQKAVFVPYKEVTKPFEMSDFYKYSTKFRQKDGTNQQHANNNIITSGETRTTTVEEVK